MTSWWRVKRQDPPEFEFMVLVIDGRVAVCTSVIATKIGAPWKNERKVLEELGFTSTMESAP